MYKKNTYGFTLIEVLVIIVILGVLVGLAVFSIGNKPQLNQLEHESMRLQSSLQWVLDEALFQNQEWGITVEENRYTFYQFDYKKKQWNKVDDIKDAEKTELKGLFEHKLPDDYWIETQVEGTPLTMATDEQEKKEDSPGLSASSATLTDESKVTPTILLLSSGEYTPFVISFGIEPEHKTLFSIKGDGVGDIQFIKGEAVEK